MFRDNKIAREISNDVLEKEIEILKQEKEVLQALLDNKKRTERSSSGWEIWPFGDVSVFWSGWRNNWKALVALVKRQRSAIKGGFLVIAILVLIMFVAAYFPHSPHGGFVTNMHHHHAYTSHTVTCTGHPTVCTPHSTYHPERWSAILCNEGDCTTVSYPDPVHWNQVHVGDWVCIDEGCSGSPPEHEEYAE